MKLGVDTAYALNKLLDKVGQPIYNDAADFGIPYNDANTKSIHNALEFVRGLEDGPATSDSRLGIIRRQAYWCPIEKDDGVTTGLEITITLYRIEQRHKRNLICPMNFKQLAFYEFEVENARR